jgi:ABC-2 type transport system ATP-binding protein
MYVQVDAPAGQAAAVLEQVAGVQRVTVADHRGGIIGYEVESAQGHDVRRDLARAVVGNGWGLLELRPLRMSLEEIFLHLTTEETEEVAHA